MNYTPEKNMHLPIQEEDSIDIKKVFSKFADKWHWFVISCFLLLLLSYLYGRYTPPLYEIEAKLLVSDDEKGGLNKQAGALMDFGGLIGAKNSVDNEAEILKTRFLMEQVVRDMQLNIVYAHKENLVTREIYDHPFKLNIVSGRDTILRTKLAVSLTANGKLNVETKNLNKVVSWNETFNVPSIGNIQFVQSPSSRPVTEKYIVTVLSIDEQVANLMEKLSVGVTNKQVTIIDMDLTYPLQKKGEDILNRLIQQYISSNIHDKNTIADSTTKFIQNRLNIIALELGDVETKVQNFKSTNKLADMTEQGKLLVQTTGEFSSELAKAETQVSILTELESYLTDDTKNKRVFPTPLLPQDIVFSDLMAQYNNLLIEREKQLLSVTEQSPFIKNIDDQITGLRSRILLNIQSNKNNYVVTRNNLRNQVSKSETKIEGVPQIEKDYLKLARNQKIKEELYIFLMQKAEETAISKTSNIAVAKIIDPPKAKVLPISPKKNIIYLVGLIFGLLIPIVIVLIKEIFNTTIATKEDITSKTRVPVIGEISHNLSSDNLIVANEGRSAISEQFRALRTNLSFFLKNKEDKVILLTSSMSGEGKSFTAINLGLIFALTGKKVLLMEFDLRKPGLSVKLGIRNDSGISNYTITPSMGYKEIVRPLSINKNMFIVSSGPLPPNPAETIMSEHIETLMAGFREDFDYIIMDAPPVGIITDAQLLSQYADATIYLVRQKVTQKTQLAIVEDLYRDGRMKNMGIVVNDIVDKQYGYGYGYGNYSEDQVQSWFSKYIIRSK